MVVSRSGPGVIRASGVMMMMVVAVMMIIIRTIVYVTLQSNKPSSYIFELWDRYFPGNANAKRFSI